MPFYRPLSPGSKSYWPLEAPLDVPTRIRAAEGLKRLRDQFAAEVPRRTLDENLLLATWNIREFDAGEKSDKRLPESLYYIAEVLAHFDLIAVQEVREDLRALDQVVSILGAWWKYIVTDVTYGVSGNGERMAFIYDSRKVAFGGLAGEVVLPEVKGVPVPQLARTPFLCGFKAHWAKFNLCTVHIYYGESKPDDPRRVKEIENLAALLEKYLVGPPAKQPGKPKTPENLILLGDFNIFSTKDATMKAMTKHGFTVPAALVKAPGSNLDQSKHYDQIAYREQRHRLEATDNAGVFDFTKSVFRPADEPTYAGAMSPDRAAAYQKQPTPAKKTQYYNTWRTFQMSDHLVLWVELRIDFGQEYLEAAAKQTP